MCGTSAGAKYNMLNRLQAASRLLIRASLALFTGLVLLLIQSAFWSNRVSAWMQLIIFATALLSYFRPHYGLLALAALAPLGQVGSRTLDSQMRGAEALVLAFLAGALVRGWTLRELRTFPSTRLEIAALIFGFVVAASCVEQTLVPADPDGFCMAVRAGAVELREPQLHHVVARLRDVVPRDVAARRDGAAVLYAARYASTSAEFTRRLVIMLVAGAVATAFLTLAARADEFARTRGSATSMIWTFSRAGDGAVISLTSMRQAHISR